MNEKSDFPLFINVEIANNIKKNGLLFNDEYCTDTEKHESVIHKEKTEEEEKNELMGRLVFFVLR